MNYHPSAERRTFSLKISDSIERRHVADHYQVRTFEGQSHPLTGQDSLPSVQDVSASERRAIH
jgi:hypothetical protein